MYSVELKNVTVDTYYKYYIYNIYIYIYIYTTVLKNVVRCMEVMGFICILRILSLYRKSLFYPHRASF